MASIRKYRDKWRAQINRLGARRAAVFAFSAGDDLKKATARTFLAFRFATETAMRAGEIVGLRWEKIDLTTRVAKLERTKIGRPRDVPLSGEAVRIIESLRRHDPVFGLNSAQLDAL
ncbi:tyrosine-type recombinase/integrase [Rhodobacter sp. 24-YEA-8]|uniref:tyrosine-type recombinase/integrase n=1 Tax=Rhodobacter sp. 24-YEA-8 TaxID=1884310 RepID=UPI00209A7E84|nr:tyrosine-type recombinase/integrase [Rhodobacter sp. 24-YEA-8]